MRRFLTLVCLLCLAIPAGISISGCYRNPAGELLQRPGLWVEGHGRGVHLSNAPDYGDLACLWADAADCAHRRQRPARGRAASVSSYTYGTTNNQLVDISPTGNICAGTWNRNSGGGIRQLHHLQPSQSAAVDGRFAVWDCLHHSFGQLGDLESGAGLRACAGHVRGTSRANSPVFRRARCIRSPLDVQACFTGSNNTQQLFCAPPSVTGATNPKLACPLPSGHEPKLDSRLLDGHWDVDLQRGNGDHSFDQPGDQPDHG